MPGPAKGSPQAQIIPASRMAVLVARFAVSGQTASEFGRQHGLTEGQTARLLSLAKAHIVPPDETLEKVRALSIRVSEGAIATAEKLATKAQKALDAFCETWPDGEIPDSQTLKRLSQTAALLLMPIRLAGRPKPAEEQPEEPRQVSGTVISC